MSLTDDHGLQNNNRVPQEHSHRVFDHTAEIASRSGLTREAAKQEMEKFLGVAEYETRKLVGQHSTLRQPDAPTQDKPKPQKRTEKPKTETLETTPVAEPSAHEEAATVQTVASNQPDATES